MLKHFSQFIDHKYKKNRAKQSFDQLMSLINLYNSWSHLIGQFLGENSLPSKIYKNTLYIVTSHQAYAQEIMNYQTHIMDKINKSKILSGIPIENLKSTYNYKSFQESKQKFDEYIHKKQANSSIKQYSKKDIEIAKNEFQDLEDQDLRELMASLYLQNHK
jgi:hypothetical protein